MPGIAKRLRLCATADGVLLHPGDSRENSGTQITYGSCVISSAAPNNGSTLHAPSVEVHGIVGTLHRPFSISHPLEPPKQGDGQTGTSTSSDAAEAKGVYGAFAQRWFSKGGRKVDATEREGKAGGGLPVVAEQKQASEDAPGTERDVKKGAQSGQQADEGDSDATKSSAATTQTSKKQDALESLTPRLLRSTKMLFSASGFFFSYDHDLSRRLAQEDEASAPTPLWKRFDDVFFWNRNLVVRFIDAGQDGLLLPLIEGFVGQRAFSIARNEGTEQHTVVETAEKPEEIVAAPEHSQASDTSAKEDLLLTLISRRSVKRAGLRYLRRGIDDDGNVANSVETEQILSTQSWESSTKTFSLVQVRGSIPLFFSQSPYSFKPLPTMFGSETTNQTALQRHFAALRERYGDVQVASLVDKHATEKPIGEAYRDHVRKLNDGGGVAGSLIGFEWFDFHSACKGMKFENVSILLETLQSALGSFGWTMKQNDRELRDQTGVVRTNCMDCLDRTNVVQSAIGGWALEQELAELGLKIDLQTDQNTQWFNTLWADNGDNISKQYAGTAALKGDFTRTRKRKWMGALADFSLSVNRYYNNIFGDFFLQLNIDFFLGNVGPNAFEEFEADMMSQDHALDMRKARQHAVDTCVQMVLEDPGEDLVSGWTVACPKEANTLRSLPFEECVLLLTNAALYFCRFDWDNEKVGSFERINLLDITELWRGAYITSTLGPTHTDEARNTGFALRYATNGKAMVRSNTRSMDNKKAVEDENADKDELEKQKSPEKDNSRLLAFKALPPVGTSTTTQQHGQEDQAEMSEEATVKRICNEVRRMMVATARKDTGADELEPDKVPQVLERDVISLADARKSTGYVESVGYSLKKLVWS
ncbi:hypothetical protein LTR53_000476 [Teratosphaeriaceae sp. CCFEE 6253]|nr:hypothetical protein LTR53_000476 [Teratosphaeriaceae sp. CCFEE 6253]